MWIPESVGRNKFYLSLPQALIIDNDCQSGLESVHVKHNGMHSIFFFMCNAFLASTPLLNVS